MKIVTYARVSTDRQGRSGLGLEAQQATISNYVAHHGAVVVGQFVEVESGRKNSRIELTRALSACRTHKATLFVAKLDRLARNQSFLMGLIDGGVDVVFGDLPHIPAGPTGRFLLQQMAAVAELEAGLISERTKAALKAKVARDGQWDRRARHHLVPGAGLAAASAARAAAVETMTEDLRDVIDQARLDGCRSIRDVMDHLNETGIPAPRGGTWGTASVRRLLARLDADDTAKARDLRQSGASHEEVARRLGRTEADVRQMLNPGVKAINGWISQATEAAQRAAE